MLHTGLTSVTFRKLKVDEIVKLCIEAGIEGIEWGGDVLVPHGDLKTARSVRLKTEDKGLKVSSYGSYYRAGCERETGLMFRDVLDTAIELNAPIIRVWAGNKGSLDSNGEWREKVAKDAKRIAEMCRDHGIKAAFEYHGGTLTDNAASAAELMEQADSEDLGIYWQPPIGLRAEENLSEIQRIHEWITNIHVFHWKDHTRLPLYQGKNLWEKYLKSIYKKDIEQYCILEFVRDDDPKAFLEDAKVLKELICNV
jgi:3-dehydroshikimate dehydratase